MKKHMNCATCGKAMKFYERDEPICLDCTVQKRLMMTDLIVEVDRLFAALPNGDWRVLLTSEHGRMVFAGDTPVLSGNSGSDFQPTDEVLEAVVLLRNSWWRFKRVVEQLRAYQEIERADRAHIAELEAKVAK